MPDITWEDFDKVEMRVGTILEIEDNVEAKKPAYKMRIDFGEYGTKTSSAQITHLNSKEDLVGKQVVCVTNFRPKKVAGFVSEVLVLGPVDKEGKCMALLKPDREVEDGLRVA